MGPSSERDRDLHHLSCALAYSRCRPAGPRPGITAGPRIRRDETSPLTGREAMPRTFTHPAELHTAENGHRAHRPPAHTPSRPPARHVSLASSLLALCPDAQSTICHTQHRLYLRGAGAHAPPAGYYLYRTRRFYGCAYQYKLITFSVTTLHLYSRNEPTVLPRRVDALRHSLLRATSQCPHPRFPPSRPRPREERRGCRTTRVRAPERPEPHSRRGGRDGAGPPRCPRPSEGPRRRLSRRRRAPAQCAHSAFTPPSPAG